MDPVYARGALLPPRQDDSDVSFEVVVFVKAVHSGFESPMIARYNYVERAWEFTDWDDEDKEFYVYETENLLVVGWTPILFTSGWE